MSYEIAWMNDGVYLKEIRLLQLKLVLCRRQLGRVIESRELDNVRIKHDSLHPYVSPRPFLPRTFV